MGDFIILSPRVASVYSLRSHGRWRSGAWCHLARLASMAMFLIIFGPRVLVHVNCCNIIHHSHLEDPIESVSLSLSCICLLFATWSAFHPVVPETHWTLVSYPIYFSASVVIILFRAAGNSERLIRACLPNLPCSHFYSCCVPRVLVQKMSCKGLGFEGV